jgi:predicted PurR-regulated permease PerM
MSRPFYQLPFFIRASLFFTGAYVFVYILYLGQDIILPLAYSALLAILLTPVVRFLGRLGLGRMMSIFLAVLFAVIITTLLLYFISAQLSQFGSRLSQFTGKIDSYITDTEKFISGRLHLGRYKIHQYVIKIKDDVFANSGIYLGHTLSTLTGMLIVIFLMPVYTMMLLYYQPLFLEFIIKVFHKENHTAVAEIMMESKVIIQSYLSGLLIEALIIALMNSAGLLIIGIDYAILLGIIGAVLNIIPYIGGIIGVALPMFVAMITKDSVSYPILVLIVYSIIQFIDNNFIVPRIVASRVRINALVSIVVVLAGGAIWGVPGMFLSIPLTAILKIIFDRIGILKPWGFLLGDSMPESPGFTRVLNKLKPSKKQA